MSVKNDNYGQFRCWLLHFSFAKNKFYFTYPLAHAQKVNQFFTFSETKPKNTFSVTVFFVLFLQDWIECFTESLDFSTELRFNSVSVFLLRLFSVTWDRFQWFCRLIIITNCIQNILFSRFDDHNNFVYTRLHLAFYLGYFRLKLPCFSLGWIVRLPFVFPVL